jgi:hypothetical protein
MDIESLRKDYLAEVEAASRTYSSTGPAEVAEYARSENRDAYTLCSMIEGLPLDAESFPASVRTLLDILSDDALDSASRLAALRHLGAAEFQPIAFAPFNAEFVETLRRLALSSDKTVRTAALDRLTLNNDPEAQRLLREGLEQTRKPLVPTAKAIQLLARDDHAAALPLFRRLAVEGKGVIREQALRALASDTKSASLFEAIAANKDEKLPLRQIAAANLKNTSATKFAKLAQNLALDSREDDKLRAIAVSAITHSSGVAAKVKSPNFAKSLRALGLATNSRALKSSITRFNKSLASK